MEKRKFGIHDEMLSIVGLGGISIKNTGQNKSDRLVRYAFDNGVNYFDVAPGYGNAQELIGPVIINNPSCPIANSIINPNKLLIINTIKQKIVPIQRDIIVIPIATNILPLCLNLSNNNPPKKVPKTPVKIVIPPNI